MKTGSPEISAPNVDELQRVLTGVPFKDTPLDEIDVSAIAQLRADLVEAELRGWI
jgi:hypothetical protein